MISVDAISQYQQAIRYKALNEIFYYILFTMANTVTSV